MKGAPLATIFVLLLAAGRALGAAPAAPAAEPGATRWAVIIGNNRGDADEATLRFAEADAVRVHDVLKGLGGFPVENTMVLLGEEAGTVRRALLALNDRIRNAAPSARGGATLMVFYSGHADARALHLGGTRLDVSELELLVRGSPAAFRLLVIDACRSGSLTRVKGGTNTDPFPIDVSIERMDGEGAVFLTSSAANEDAQESDDVGGSFFTHYFVSGLLGAADANGDGRVLLEEVYAYAYENTLRASSRTMAGLQHPTFRYDVRGRGAIVLSTVDDLRGTRGRLQLPASRPFLVLRGGREGPVVGEMGARDPGRRLTLPAGRYFVRGRSRDALLEGEVEVRPGATTVVDERLLTRTEYARLVRKGGERTASPGVLAGYRARSALLGGSLCQGAFAGYGVDWQRLTAWLRLAYCQAAFENGWLAGQTRELSLDVRLAHAFDLPGVTVDLALAAGAALLRQRFTTQGAAPPRTTTAGRLAAELGVFRDLRGGYFLVGTAGAEIYLLRRRSEGAERPTFGPSVAAGGSLGLGKRW